MNEFEATYTHPSLGELHIGFDVLKKGEARIREISGGKQNEDYRFKAWIEYTRDGYTGRTYGSQIRAELIAFANSPECASAVQQALQELVKCLSKAEKLLAKAAEKEQTP